MIVLEDQTHDPDGATQLKVDDDFLLTPLEETASEELDSGSQVIALDADEFEESAGTLLESGSGLSGVTALEDDLGGPQLGGLPPASALQPAGVMVHAGPDITFTPWNIALLSICLVFLILAGMMIYDLMRNMWSWQGAYPVNSTLMDWILSWLPS